MQVRPFFLPQCNTLKGLTKVIRSNTAIEICTMHHGSYRTKTEEKLSLTLIVVEIDALLLCTWCIYVILMRGDTPIT